MTAQTHADGRPRRFWMSIPRTITADYGLVLVMIMVIVAFSLLRSDTYFTLTNFEMVTSTNAVLAILALATILPLITGQFDLSVGFQLALAQAVCASLIVKYDASPIVGIAAAILLSLIIGFVNGLLVAYAKLNAFIATLGTGILVQGMTQVVTNGESVFGQMPPWWLAIGRSEIIGLPLPLIYVLVLTSALWAMLEYTTWGRRAFAIGGNARAALLVGVPVRSMILQAYLFSGALSAVAGVLSASILGSANPNVGVNYLLPAFAAAFLGATSIRPGRFNAWGTIVAVFTLAAGINGLQQLGAPFYIEQFFNGGALVLAISLAKWAEGRRRNSPEEVK
jgi:ribose transport system permease protein